MARGSRQAGGHREKNGAVKRADTRYGACERRRAERARISRAASSGHTTDGRRRLGTPGDDATQCDPTHHRCQIKPRGGLPVGACCEIQGDGAARIVRRRPFSWTGGDRRRPLRAGRRGGTIAGRRQPQR